MLHRIGIRKVEEKENTTQYELLGASPPMKDFYVNTELVTSLPFDAEEMLLTLSTEPFADGEVTLAFPPVPFFKAFNRVVRYEHRIRRKGKERRAPNTPELGVTLAYVNKTDLEDEVIVKQKPIHFGLSPVAKCVMEGEELASVADIEIGDELFGADAIAAFDAFLRESIRVQRSGRLTSRQIWAVWAARCDGNPDDKVIAGVRFADVARRFRGVFGAAAARTPTRIDGYSQRYWAGYEI